MSCSGEIYSHSNTDTDLIQITPAAKQKLKKAKYGVFNHSAVELCHWTKKSFSMVAHVISTNFMEYLLIDVWK